MEINDDGAEKLSKALSILKNLFSLNLNIYQKYIGNERVEKLIEGVS